jgi:hypothetical protein
MSPSTPITQIPSLGFIPPLPLWLACQYLLSTHAHCSLLFKMPVSLFQPNLASSLGLLPDCYMGIIPRLPSLVLCPSVLHTKASYSACLPGPPPCLGTLWLPVFPPQKLNALLTSQEPPGPVSVPCFPMLPASPVLMRLFSSSAKCPFP